MSKSPEIIASQMASQPLIVHELDSSDLRKGISVTYDPNASSIAESVYSPNQLASKPNIHEFTPYSGGVCLTDTTFAIEPYLPYSNETIGGQVNKAFAATGRIADFSVTYPNLQKGGETEHKWAMFDGARMPAILGMHVDIKQKAAMGRVSDFYPLVYRMFESGTGDSGKQRDPELTNRNLYIVTTRKGDDFYVNSLIDGTEPHPIDAKELIARPHADGSIEYKEPRFLDYAVELLGQRIKADPSDEQALRAMAAYRQMLKMTASRNENKQKVLYEYITMVGARILNEKTTLSKDGHAKAKSLFNDVWPKLEIADIEAATLQHTFLRASDLLKELAIYDKMYGGHLSSKGREDIRRQRANIFVKVIAGTAFMQLMGEAEDSTRAVEASRQRLNADGFHTNLEYGHNIRFTAVSLDETDQAIHNKAVRALRAVTTDRLHEVHEHGLGNLVNYVSGNAEEAAFIVRAIENNQLARYESMSRRGSQSTPQEMLAFSRSAMPNGAYSHYGFEMDSSLEGLIDPSDPRFRNGLAKMGVVTRFSSILPEQDPHTPEPTEHVVFSGKDIEWELTKTIVARARSTSGKRRKTAAHILDGEFGMLAHMRASRIQTWNPGRFTLNSRGEPNGVDMIPETLANGDSFAIAASTQMNDPTDPRKNEVKAVYDIGHIPGHIFHREKPQVRWQGKVRKQNNGETVPDPVYQGGTIPYRNLAGLPERSDRSKALLEFVFAGDAVHLSSARKSNSGVSTKAAIPKGFIDSHPVRGRRKS